jgi:hypothetical protein
VAEGTTKAPPRPPKEKHIGFDHDPSWKLLLTSDGKARIVDGEEVYYYEYGATIGDGCRIEVVCGPKWLQNWTSKWHTRWKAKLSRRECVKDLDRFIADHMREVEAQNARAAADAASEKAKSSPEANDDAASEKAKSSPEANDDAASEEAKSSPKANDDAASKEEPVLEQGKDSGGELPETKAEAAEKKHKLTKAQRKDKNEMKKASRLGYRFVKASEKHVQEANENIDASFQAIKKIDALQKKLETLPGDTQQKAQLAEAFSQARIYQEKQAARQAERIVAAKVTHVAGKALISGGRQLNEEVSHAKAAFGDALGANIADAVLNLGEYKDLQDVSVKVVSASAKSAAVGAVERVALETFKGAIEEISKPIADKIPGLNVIHATFTIGQTIFNAQTAQEAVVNSVHVGVNLGVSTGCAALGQILIPIPFAGAAAGSLVGGLVNKGIDWGFEAAMA